MLPFQNYLAEKYEKDISKCVIKQNFTKLDHNIIDLTRHVFQNNKIEYLDYDKKGINETYKKSLERMEGKNEIVGVFRKLVYTDLDDILIGFYGLTVLNNRNILKETILTMFIHKDLYKQPKIRKFIHFDKNKQKYYFDPNMKS